MWPRDTATWLAIVAIFLVVPLNFLSTWAYPKVQNWWNAHSRKSLQKQIARVRASLTNIKNHNISKSDQLILLCMEYLGTLIFITANALAFVMLILAAPIVRLNRHPWSLAVGIGLSLGAVNIAKDYVSWRMREFLHIEELKEDELELLLEDLTTKLAAREAAKH